MGARREREARRPKRGGNLVKDPRVDAVEVPATHSVLPGGAGGPVQRCVRLRRIVTVEVRVWKMENLGIIARILILICTCSTG